MSFENLIKSYPFQVYIEVSKNHNIPLGDVIRRKFDPEVRILIMYYNHQLRLQEKEYEKIKKEQEKIKNRG